jgi:hypothetical protein
MGSIDETRTTAGPVTQVTTVTKKPLGVLKDPSGDFSSGRVVKVGSWIVAIALALMGVIYRVDTSIYVGAFLGVALGSEITQKTTGT